MSQKKNILTLSTFRGCDYTNAGTDMDMDKSPNCVNMIRDVPGKLRKRMGYYKENNYGAQINGYHYLANENLACVHAGTEIYNVGGDKKSAYFKDYSSGGKTGYLYFDIETDRVNFDEDEHKTPNVFVGVGTNGYISGKHDKLVGGNAITNMRSVCYGAGRFVSVGDSGRAYCSLDNGKNWSKMEGMPTNKNFTSVAYDEEQNLFIAVGNQTIYCCRDGLHWYNACPNTTLNYNFNGVSGVNYVSNNDNKYALIVGTNGYALLKKGSSVVANGDEVFQYALSGTRIACVKCTRSGPKNSFTEAQYIVVGANIVERWSITTVNGTPNVTRQNIAATNTYRAVTRADDSTYYAVGDSGVISKIAVGELLTNSVLTALDKPKGESNNLYGIAYNGEHYVVICNNTNHVYYTSDLKNWTKLKVKYSTQYGVVAPIKNIEEQYFNLKVYFQDYTNIDVLPIMITDNGSIKTLLYDLTYYNASVRSIVSEYYMSSNASVSAGPFGAGHIYATSVESLYSGANNEKSISISFANKVFILDGKNILVYDGYSVAAIKDIAYVPKLTISKDPNGGGTDFEALNLLQPAFTEDFYVKVNSSATNFQMTFGELDPTEVKAWVKNSNLEWVRKYENTDFTVDRITGIVTFSSAIGASPVEGEDNVRITAYRTVDGYADRINKCTIGTLFGVGGAQDRLFVSGNPDKKYFNYDWYSQQNDATYFGDTSYCTVGNSSSKILGYAIINNYLATFKGDGEEHQNVIIRQGNLADSKPTFPLINTLQGEPAIAKHSFQYFTTEPIFLTKSGIMAITSQDITSEKYTQDRSFYINGKLLKESLDDLKNACSVIYKDMYLLAVNGSVYVLDGIQPMQTDKSLPYATRQYACFYCDNIPARVMWVDSDGVLCFGSENGDIFKFYTDESDIESYTDNGEPINAIYETPDLSGSVFFKNKTFKFLAVRMGEYALSSIKIWVQRNGLWSMIKHDRTRINHFSFEQMCFSRLTFDTNATPKSTTTKMRVKKVDKLRIRLSNDSLKEPFSFRDIGIEYTERGNHK